MQFQAALDLCDSNNSRSPAGPAASDYSKLFARCTSSEYFIPSRGGPPAAGRTGNRGNSTANITVPVVRDRSDDEFPLRALRPIRFNNRDFIALFYYSFSFIFFFHFFDGFFLSSDFAVVYPGRTVVYYYFYSN